MMSQWPGILHCSMLATYIIIISLSITNIINMLLPSLLILSTVSLHIKPQMLYLQEDVTMNAEFPEEGRFHNLFGSRYKVCALCKILNIVRYHMSLYLKYYPVICWLIPSMCNSLISEGILRNLVYYPLYITDICYSTCRITHYNCYLLAATVYS